MQDLLEFLGQRINEETNLQKKAQYRRDMIKAIINSYPPKSPIHMREFSQAVGFRPQASSIYMMLNQMIQKGEIKAYGTGQGAIARSYIVLKPGNTYEQERGAEPTPEKLLKEGYVSPKQVIAQREHRAREAEQLNNEIGDSVEKAYTFEELEELAMKFQFYNYGIAMTAAQFLEKLKEV